MLLFSVIFHGGTLSSLSSSSSSFSLSLLLFSHVVLWLLSLLLSVDVGGWGGPLGDAHTVHGNVVYWAAGSSSQAQRAARNEVCGGGGLPVPWCDLQIGTA